MKCIVWPWLAESFPGMLGRPFSFFPKRRPMEDLMLFFLAALLRESWLLLLLLGLLPWPSCRPDRLSTSKGRETWEGETIPEILSKDGRAQSPPSDVSDVFVARSMAGLPVQPHGAWRGGRGCLTADRGLVILGGLWNNGTETWQGSFRMLWWADWKWTIIRVNCKKQEHCLLTRDVIQLLLLQREKKRKICRSVSVVSSLKDNSNRFSSGKKERKIPRKEQMYILLHVVLTGI